MPRPSLKERKDGRYKCVYKGIQFYGATQSEAYGKRDKYKDDLKRGLRAEAAGVTVNEYSKRWVDAYKSGVKPNVKDIYTRYLADLGGICGNKVLQDVTTTDIQITYNLRAGRSNSNIKAQAATISSMFESALADGLILRNPCKKATRHEGPSGTHRALEDWERDVVVSMSTSGHRFALVALTMLYAGLRRGEALALNVERDVDFNLKRIYVREAISYDAQNAPTLGDPKTEAGTRSIPLLKSLEDVLKEHHGLLVNSKKGGYLTFAEFRCAWADYLRKCEEHINGGMTKRQYAAMSVAGQKLPAWRAFHARTHDFRHTFCTMLYEAGVDLKSAQKWMGHADESMILKIYAHLTDKQENRAVNLLREAMGEKV